MMRLKRRLSLGPPHLKVAKGISSAEFDFNNVLPSPKDLDSLKAPERRRRKQSLTSAATVPGTPDATRHKFDMPPELSIDDLWATDSQDLEEIHTRSETPFVIATPTSSIFPRFEAESTSRSVDLLGLGIRQAEEEVEELAQASQDAVLQGEGSTSKDWDTSPKGTSKIKSRQHGEGYHRRHNTLSPVQRLQQTREDTAIGDVHTPISLQTASSGTAAADEAGGTTPEEAPLAEITIVQRRPSVTKSLARHMSLRQIKQSSSHSHSSSDKGEITPPAITHDEVQLSPSVKKSLASAGWQATKARSHAKSDAGYRRVESGGQTRRRTMHSTARAAMSHAGEVNAADVLTPDSRGHHDQDSTVFKKAYLSAHKSTPASLAPATPHTDSGLGDWESGRRLGERIERLKRAQQRNESEGKPRSATIPHHSPKILDRAALRDRALSADTASDHFTKLAKLAAPRKRSQTSGQDESVAEEGDDSVLRRAREDLARYNRLVHRAARHICESALSAHRPSNKTLCDLPQSLFPTATRDLTLKERRENVSKLMIHLIHALAHSQLCEPLCLALTPKEASVAETMVTAVRSRFPVPAALLWEVQLCEAMIAMRKDGTTSTRSNKMLTQAETTKGRRTTRETRIADTVRQVFRQVVRLLQSCGMCQDKEDGQVYFERGSKDLIAALEALYEVGVACTESRLSLTESDALALEVSLWGGPNTDTTGLGITEGNRHDRRALMALDGGPMQDTLDECLQELGDFLQRDPVNDEGLPGMHTLLTVSELGLVGLDLFGNVHIHEKGSRRRVALPQVRAS